MSIPLSRRGFVASLGLGAVVAAIPTAMVRRLRAEEAQMVEPMPKAPTVPKLQTLDTTGSARAVAMLEASMNVQLAMLGYRLQLYGSPEWQYLIGEVLTLSGERAGERFHCQLRIRRPDGDRPADAAFITRQVRYYTVRCIEGHNQLLSRPDIVARTAV